MAHNQELSLWVLNHANALKLQIKNLDWISHYFKGWTDLRIQIELDSQIYEGRGSDVDPDIALIKGFAEAVERFVCRQNGITSIGVAGHSDLDLAKENAFLEFVERSAIAFHFNKKLGMKVLSAKSLLVNSKDFGKINFKVHQFQMITAENISCIFTLAEGIDSGLAIGAIMGAAASRNLEDAIRKSSIECFRNVAALSVHSLVPMPVEEFRKIEKPTSQDSQRLLFDKNYCQNLLKQIYNKNSDETHSKFSLNNLIFEKIKYDHALLKNCPLEFIRCLDQNHSPAPDTEFVG